MVRSASFSYGEYEKLELTKIKSARNKSPVGQNGTEKLLEDEQARLELIKNMNVPKFLINKWLNIQNQKSKFAQRANQFDNEEDISIYSEITQSNKSVINSNLAISSMKRRSRISSKKSSSQLVKQGDEQPAFASVFKTKNTLGVRKSFSGEFSNPNQ